MADRIAQSISCHAYNADKSLVAFSPNNSEIHIHVTNGSTDSSKWEKTARWVLAEHSGPVSGIDWSAVTNQIVTCGHDRNAYVWNLITADEKTGSALSESQQYWKPSLVILRIKRAATAVKWAPSGAKFAVASGNKCVPVCSFDERNNFWVTQMIKKHKSTVLSVAWCPNSKFVITGSSDMKARIFSAYLEGVDAAEDDGFGEVFPKQHEFGECLAEFDQANAWVHAVAWAPGGFRLAFAGHGSTVHFVQILSGSAPLVQTLRLPNLPFLDIAFVNDSTVVAAGFDMNPAVFTVSGGSDAEPVWSFKEWLDKKDKNAAKPASSGVAAAASAFGGARQMFSNAVDRGHSFGSAPASDESTIATKHKNVIPNLFLLTGADGAVKSVSTCGLDGRVFAWDL